MIYAASRFTEVAENRLVHLIFTCESAQQSFVSNQNKRDDPFSIINIYNDCELVALITIFIASKRVKLGG